jgi:hypothetical protein
VTESTVAERNRIIPRVKLKENTVIGIELTAFIVRQVAIKLPNASKRNKGTEKGMT